MMRIDAYWWQADDGDEHDAVFDVVRSLDDRQGGVRDAQRDHLGLYLDREIADYTSAIRVRQNPLFGATRNLNLNVIKSCIDTVAAKIVAHRPRPMYLTSAGRFQDRQKAKKLERWTDGLFYREKLYTKWAPHVFLDSAIFGTGALKVFEDDGEVCMEWCWIGELIVDEVNALYTEPRVMYQRRFMSRDVLKTLYPDYIEEIDAVDAEENVEVTVASDDVIEVVEAWHLPSGKGTGDGRHAICITTATLFSEEWTEDDFPFVFFRWGRSPLGFYGVGLAEELHGIQVEIKHLLERIQESMQLTATAWVLKPRSTKISDEHISNRIGAILEYDGMQPPKVETPASMNSQVFEHLWQLYDRAYEIAGISQLSASGKKPAGIESGVALRTVLDVETQRFALLARDWEEFYLDVARKCVQCAKKAYRGGGGKIKWADRNIVQEIEWKDVNLNEDSYVLRIYPVNLLPQTPSGKLATVQDLLNMQLLNPQEAKSLLDFPDLDKVQDLTNAAYEDMLQIMDGILYEGDYVPPAPEMFLEAGIRLANHYWCLGRQEGAPADRLEDLTRWMEEAKAMMAPPEMMPPMGEAPPEAMPPEGMPPEGAMPPPGMEGMAPPPTPADMMAAGQPPPPPVAL